MPTMEHAHEIQAELDRGIEPEDLEAIGYRPPSEQTSTKPALHAVAAPASAESSTPRDPAVDAEYDRLDKMGMSPAGVIRHKAGLK